jgi:hypothetical protein
MKQTAVQWLIETITLGLSEKGMKTAFDKALEMEKEQIMNSWLVDGYTDLTDENWKKEFEEYYKETYETKETN